MKNVFSANLRACKTIQEAADVTRLRRWRQQFQELGDAGFPGQGNCRPGTPNTWTNSMS